MAYPPGLYATILSDPGRGGGPGQQVPRLAQEAPSLLYLASCTAYSTVPLTGTHESYLFLLWGGLGIQRDERPVPLSI